MQKLTKKFTLWNFCKIRFITLSLLLITFGLLFGLQNAFYDNSSIGKSSAEIIADDQNNSENENCELEDWQFFDNNIVNFQILKISLNPESKNTKVFLENFPSVPTSPPNC
ncbi:MAG: hypothetical protein SFV53_00960 [Rickettsiales bacterium]|nr:hypothetical protein [Rickettsiales bacterium]